VDITGAEYIFYMETRDYVHHTTPANVLVPLKDVKYEGPVWAPGL